MQLHLRQKQLAEFNEEEKDLLESISALKSAVTVLIAFSGFSRFDLATLNLEPPNLHRISESDFSDV